MNNDFQLHMIFNIFIIQRMLLVNRIIRDILCFLGGVIAMWIKWRLDTNAVIRDQYQSVQNLGYTLNV